jgi:ATP-dependent 26S proteasome regulatory subunit
LAYNARKRQEYQDAWVSYAQQVRANFVDEGEQPSQEEDSTDSALTNLQNCPKQTLDMLALLQYRKEHGPSDIDPRGILLYGPPGTGKTTMAKALAQDAGLRFEHILGADFSNKYLGEGRRGVQELFARLRSLQHPVALIVDEIDAIGASDVVDQHPEYQAIALTFWNELSDEKNSSILVIGTTNRYTELAEAFKRSGRFDHHIQVGLPQNDVERENILRFYLSKAQVTLDDDAIHRLAQVTPGYSGQDFATIVKKSRQRVAVERIDGDESLQCVFLEEIEQRRAAVNQILRSGPYYYPVLDPRVNLEEHVPNGVPLEVGTLSRGLKDPSQYSQLHMNPEKQQSYVAPGLLLYGPPGNGKTLTAEAFAGTVGAKFISIVASAFSQKYVGEGSRYVEALFKRAQDYVQQNPQEKVVIFIDEIDAIGCKRSTSDDSRGDASTLLTLLHELDNLENDSIFVIAATNRDAILDEALMRRFRTQAPVTNPDESNRKKILAYYLKQKKQTLMSSAPYQSGVNDGMQEKGREFLQLVAHTKDFSCSDLKLLVDRALMIAADG